MAAGGEGSTFGKYFLLKKLAAGGMGEIFLAKLKGPVGFEKLLVIKRILAQHVENQEFVDMFFAEARVAAQLSHNNIVQIYEMGEIEDAYFIGMEYVHGKSLRDVIDKARERGESLHPAHAIEIISRMCAGMSYAHNSKDMSGAAFQIIHRDLNPHNLLVSYSGDVKIIDFGIAKSEMNVHKTETGTIKGKFVYMSPEQSAAEKLDKRSDIFPIGICLYETLTFTNPFAKANIVMSLDAIQRKEAPPLSEFNPKLAIFDPIVKKALAKKVDERYADANDMKDDLQALLRTGAVEQPPQALPDFMHDLFEDQIDAEKRMILETDQANTTQIEAMRDFRKSEHRSGSHSKIRVKQKDVGEELDELEEAAHSSAMALEQPRSRLPFILLLCSIIIATTAGAVAIVKVVQSRSAGPTTTITDITPLGGPVALNTTGQKPPEVTHTPPPQQPPQNAMTAQEERHERERERERDRGRGKSSRDREREERQSPQPAQPTSSNQGGGMGSNPPPPPPPPPQNQGGGGGGGGGETPPPPTPPAAVGFGNLIVSSVPPVQVTLGGGNIGQSLKLKSGTGRLVFGAGKDPVSDPFKVTISYRVTGQTIMYVVDADPWAIVKDKSGSGLGKTPLPPIEGGGSNVFEFANPKDGRKLRVNLRFSPP